MLGLFSGESRCCKGVVRRVARYGSRRARLTYHVQGIAPGRGRDAELALLLSGGHTADARAASESPGSEFGGHCEGVCEGVVEGE